MSPESHPESTQADYPLIVERLERQSVTTPPSIIVIHPTDRCNHHCDWCWYDRSRDEIPRSLISRVSDNSIVDPKWVREVVVAGGGEPLLYPDIDGLINGVKDACPGARLKLDTNGTLLRRLEPATLKRIDYVRFSIDAIDAEEYSRTRHIATREWNRLLSNIEWSRSVAPETTLGASFVEHSPRDDSEFAKFASELSLLGIEWIFRKPVLTSTLTYEKHPTGVVNGEHPSSLVRSDNFVEAHESTTVPIEIASMLVLVGSDGGIYTCYHSQGNPRQRLALLSDSSFDDDLVRQKWMLHSRNTHPCRVFSAWNSWSNTHLNDR